jgi:MHS family proline/betaine transporter-like MFS transporter
MHDKNKTFFAAITGNILEYYDFTVYAVFSYEIGKSFFPVQAELVQIINSLAVFAVGFLTRPIGGVLFGYIGDNYGRRIALILSMIGITIPTIIIGLCPSYYYIGIGSTIILIIMRLLQGLCISGEGAGAAIFVLEHFHGLRSGLVTSLIQCANIAGTILATLIGLLINSYLGDYSNAWRLAFLAGGIFGLIGFYLRLKVSETPIFEEMRGQKKQTGYKASFFKVVKNSWYKILIALLCGAMASSVVYLIKSYINVFYIAIMHYDNILALKYLLFTSAILITFIPMFGMLADRFNAIRIITINSIMTLLLIYPIMHGMANEDEFIRVLSLLSLGIVAASVVGVAYIFILNTFTASERYTGVGFGYNLGIAIFGGNTPMISTWLVHKTSIIASPAFYIISIILLFLLINNLPAWYRKLAA